MAALFSGGGSINDITLWTKSLAVYEKVIKAVDENKRSRKSAKNDQESLESLDSWYQKDLPRVVESRSPPHLTHEELARLMKWKLTRGKFRPRLTEMVKENTPAKVEELTSKAFSQLPNTRKAVETLKQLRAVGPATASAILCLYKPECAPFMSDEATSSIPGIGKLDYSLNQYLVFAESMCEKAKELNQTDKKRSWTAHDVELALWSYTVANRLVPELLECKQTTTRPSSENNSGPSSDRTDSPPPTKKRKKK